MSRSRGVPAHVSQEGRQEVQQQGIFRKGASLISGWRLAFQAECPGGVGRRRSWSAPRTHRLPGLWLAPPRTEIAGFGEQVQVHQKRGRQVVPRTSVHLFRLRHLLRTLQVRATVGLHIHLKKNNNKRDAKSRLPPLQRPGPRPEQGPPFAGSPACAEHPRRREQVRQRPRASLPPRLPVGISRRERIPGWKKEGVARRKALL